MCTVPRGNCPNQNFTAIQTYSAPAIYRYDYEPRRSPQLSIYETSGSTSQTKSPTTRMGRRLVRTISSARRRMRRLRRRLEAFYGVEAARVSLLYVARVSGVLLAGGVTNNVGLGPSNGLHFLLCGLYLAAVEVLGGVHIWARNIKMAVVFQC
jgi:hypothetical protein